ncbi:hypothetical protein BE04_04545 [Sorangium cellulosum]|uniref:Uncharacterized protein n=2 Tax=Sorangium cellulosum TaxID=56 RepID=A0A150P7U7_SORCE|nr:hypothetical protein SCE1572_10275 [Sorangium cellulosum So0157-2]KYF51784.1 hypothetical protein BE04_04545 [Sorangium cellulosum]
MTLLRPEKRFSRATRSTPVSTPLKSEGLSLSAAEKKFRKNSVTSSKKPFRYPDWIGVSYSSIKMTTLRPW